MLTKIGRFSTYAIRNKFVFLVSFRETYGKKGFGRFSDLENIVGILKTESMPVSIVYEIVCVRDLLILTITDVLFYRLF